MAALRPWLHIAPLLCLSALACRPSSSSLYPLGEGEKWTYQLQIGSGTTMMTITNMATRELEGQKVTPQRVETGGATSFSFVADVPDGICEIAKQRANSMQPEVHDPPLCYLKRPYKAGTTWELPAETHFVAAGTELTLTVTLEQDDETITVPAGTFEHCLRLSGQGQADREVGLFMGKATISSKYVAWYCPGVGLAKLVSKEESNHLMLGSGELSYQLVEHSA